jgi:hypothetical protein
MQCIEISANVDITIAEWNKKNDGKILYTDDSAPRITL